MRPVTLLVALSLSAALWPSVAPGQGKGGHEAKAQPGRSQPQMTQQDRQRMRDDMRDAYRDRSRDRQRPMTREEREKLRQDIQNANKELRR